MYDRKVHVLSPAKSPSISPPNSRPGSRNSNTGEEEGAGGSGGLLHSPVPNVRPGSRVQLITPISSSSTASSSSAVSPHASLNASPLIVTSALTETCSERCGCFLFVDCVVVICFFFWLIFFENLQSDL